MREGLMCDVGYHDIDKAEEHFDKFCIRCKHLNIIEENGEKWIEDCKYSDCRFEEEEDE